MAWQITICSRCGAAGHLRRCWRTRLRDAFAAQNVSVIERVGRAASACVFQSRSGVAWFVCDAARLSLTGGLCHTRLPSLNARALSKQVLPDSLHIKSGSRTLGPGRPEGRLPGPCARGSIIYIIYGQASQTLTQRWGDRHIGTLDTFVFGAESRGGGYAGEFTDCHLRQSLKQLPKGTPQHPPTASQP